MNTQIFCTATQVGSILLSSLLLLQVSVCLAQFDGLSSAFYEENPRMQGIKNLVMKAKDMGSKSQSDLHRTWMHKVELSEDTDVWNQRMRRNWNTDDTASSVQDCGKDSPCSSIATGEGATANIGTVTVDSSRLKGVVGTKSHVTQSTNMAIGKEAEANMGNVIVHSSKIKGTVTNESRIRQSANKAIGIGAVANMGSTTVQGSRSSGRVSNQSRVKQSLNQAQGKGATANMGSVTVDESRIKGMVTNESRVKQSANKAIGKGATANMGSIDID